MEASKQTGFVATIRAPVQISPDDWEVRSTSRVFHMGASMRDILLWVESLGIKQPTVSSIAFSELSA